MDSRDKPETGEGFLFSNFNKLPCFVCVSDMSVYEQEVALLYLIKKIYTSSKTNNASLSWFCIFAINVSLAVNKHAALAHIC